MKTQILLLIAAFGIVVYSTTVWFMTDEWEPARNQAIFIGLLAPTILSLNSFLNKSK